MRDLGIGAPFPKDLGPELATLAKEAPDGPAWVHEAKFDGYRMLAFVRGGKARMVSRRGNDWTARYGPVVAALEGLGLPDAIIDGEVVALNDKGLSDFQTLQLAMKLGGRARLAYYAFDLPYFDGRDLTGEQLVRRKKLLASILPVGEEGVIRYSDHVEGNGPEVFRNACRLGLEGIISKRAASPYVQRRSDDWLKVKCVKGQELVIGGFTEPQRSRKHLGALHVGYYRDGELRYAGKVGTGYTEATLRQLHGLLKPLEQERPPFVDPPTGHEARGSHWVKPRLVGEFAFTEWTEDGILRHPVYKGLREDKRPEEVRREDLPHEKAGGGETPGKGATRTTNRVGARGARSPARNQDEVVVEGVRLTSPEKVLYPDVGITKRELAEYYAAVADRMLPHVAGRPLTIWRCPAGQGTKCFVQKHLKAEQAEHLEPIRIREKNETDTYFMVRDAAGLIALVQLGTLEMHPWGSTDRDLERPDRLIFDLDPGPGVAWAHLVEGARLVRDRLRALGLESFVKTSGGKGLHVVVPIRPGAGWEEAKEFSRHVAEAIAADEPERYLVTMTKARRAGKVFIDYLRNGRGATAVAPYSTRAREGATVAMPLSWEDLGRGVEPGDFTVRTVPRLLARRRSDPWAGVPRPKRALTREVMERARAGRVGGG